MSSAPVGSRPASPSVPVLAVLLALAMGLAAFPIVALSVLGPVVVTELGLSRIAFGSVSTTMFMTAVLVSLIAGQIVDRFGPRLVLGILYSCITFAIILLANARSLANLLATAVIVGLAQGTANPVTNAVIARWVSRGATGTVVGLKQSGVPLTQFAAGAFLAPVAAALGWRAAVLTGFALIVPSVIATLAIIPRSERRSIQGFGLATAAPAGLRWIYLCMFLLAMALQANNVYLPLFAFQAGGLTPVAAGMLVGIVGFIGIGSRILFGRISSRDVDPVRLVVGIASVATIAAFGLLVAPSVHGVVLWVSAMTLGASLFGFNVVGMTVVLRSVEQSMAGRASGSLATLMFLGFALGPLAYGALADLFGTYTSSWAFVVGCCAVSAGVSVRVLLTSTESAA